jgi:ribosomal protein L29
MTKYKDLSAKGKDELLKMKNDLELELINLRGQVSKGVSPKDSSRISNIRKDIARINMILAPKKGEN